MIDTHPRACGIPRSYLAYIFIGPGLKHVHRADYPTPFRRCALHTTQQPSPIRNVDTLNLTLHHDICPCASRRMLAKHWKSKSKQPSCHSAARPLPATPSGCRPAADSNGALIPRWRVWRDLAEYFPVRLHKTADLDPQGTYVFGFHPHGILCLSAWVSFATEACDVGAK